MRKRIIPGLFVLNGFLAIVVWATPAATQITALAAFRDCCHGSGSSAYCCNNCCVFVENCEDDEDCWEN